MHHTCAVGLDVSLMSAGVSKLTTLVVHEPDDHKIQIYVASLWLWETWDSGCKMWTQTQQIVSFSCRIWSYFWETCSVFIYHWNRPWGSRKNKIKIAPSVCIQKLSIC